MMKQRSPKSSQKLARAPTAHLRAVLRAYLASFAPGEGRTLLLAAALSHLVPHLAPHVRSLHDAYELSQPDRAIESVAAVLAPQGIEEEVQHLARVRPRIPSSSLGAHAGALALRNLDGSNVTDYEAVLAKIVNPDGTFSGALRSLLYPALVMPFESEEPSSGVRQRILDLIRAEYGDPRMPQTALPSLQDDHDGSTARRCTDVVRRWLAVDTLELFIAVIDRTAVDSMWRARREFWKAYADAGHIHDVHVVFSTQAGRVAHQVRHDKGLSGLRWGKLKGAMPDHSVMLMRIAGLTIAEWSHSGALRFWRATDELKPKLHRHEYQAFDLRRGSMSVRNPRTNSLTPGITHDAGGNWRAFAARVIAQETGVRT